jgi:polynucleotide 5'-kinase involved in rRNA processing
MWESDSGKSILVNYLAKKYLKKIFMMIIKTNSFKPD